MGLFPDDLTNIFPWLNFYNGLMESFIAKEEYTGSLHAIENRYPFLDKYVVQEFLWLSAELKNIKYKSPLYNYMLINNYPFQENEKLGFKAKLIKTQNDNIVNEIKNDNIINEIKNDNIINETKNNNIVIINNDTNKYIYYKTKKLI